MENVANDIEFQFDDVIEIDYGEFYLYKIKNCWYAKHEDSEKYDEEILLEDVNQNLIFEGGEVFGTIISKEEFDRYRSLE